MSSKKQRKPYTLTKQREKWSAQEHSVFERGLELHGRHWKRIHEMIGTKTVVQIRSHAQKHFIKLRKRGMHHLIPPPRPRSKKGSGGSGSSSTGSVSSTSPSSSSVTAAASASAAAASGKHQKVKSKKNKGTLKTEELPSEVVDASATLASRAAHIAHHRSASAGVRRAQPSASVNGPRAQQKRHKRRKTLDDPSILAGAIPPPPGIASASAGLHRSVTAPVFPMSGQMPSTPVQPGVQLTKTIDGEYVVLDPNGTHKVLPSHMQLPSDLQRLERNRIRAAQAEQLNKARMLLQHASAQLRQQQRDAPAVNETPAPRQPGKVNAAANMAISHAASVLSSAPPQSGQPRADANVPNQPQVIMPQVYRYMSSMFNPSAPSGAAPPLGSLSGNQQHIVHYLLSNMTSSLAQGVTDNDGDASMGQMAPRMVPSLGDLYSPSTMAFAGVSPRLPPLATRGHFSAANAVSIMSPSIMSPDASAATVAMMKLSEAASDADPSADSSTTADSSTIGSHKE